MDWGEIKQTTRNATKLLNKQAILNALQILQSMCKSVYRICISTQGFISHQIIFAITLDTIFDHVQFLF